jgi:hypothetical protein
MRYSLAILLFLASGCSPSDVTNELGGKPPGNQAAAVNDGPAATISLASGGTGDCTTRWDGEPLTRQALGQRAFALMDARVQAAGGPASVTEDNLPYLRVEAAPDLPWPCAGETLRTLRESAFGLALLRPAGAREAPDQRLYLPVIAEEPLDPSRRIAVGPGGAVTQTGTAIDRPGLREFARSRSMGGPDDFIVAPSDEATFGDVYQILIDLNVGDGGVTLAASTAPEANSQ